MNERVRELHRRIAACRDLLARGPAASEAMHYLRQIMEAEAELERIKIAEVQPQLDLGRRPQPR
jgi:hypothetical protein